MAKKPNPARGIWKHKQHPHDPDVKVVDFSYDGDLLAQLVVEAWESDGNPNGLKAKLLDHTHQNIVQQELANRGFFLNHPVVLTEDEYDQGWEQDDVDEVVLVLPNDGRKTAPGGTWSLLETAKLLMAVTPNGI